MSQTVIKRNGKTELRDENKICKVLEWGAVGLNVSVSEVWIKVQKMLVDGMKTSDIHASLVKTAADLISEEYPDYQYFAARLAMFGVRKDVFGTFNPPPLDDFITHMINIGKYDEHLTQDFTPKEIAELDKHIKHDRDMDFAYAGVKQLMGKYLIQNRKTKELYETPQFLYMCVAMALHAKEPKNKRLQYIKEFYDAVSTFEISLPTPIMSGVRTPTRQFSSCVKIESGDSLKSINATAASIVSYVSQRAGIGINAGRIRALGSEIRGGEAVHTGCIPYYKYFQTAVKCCSQGGVRGGAATVFYPMWHLEYKSLIVLKNNRGIEENRVRHMDYGVQINGLMYKRLLSGQNITLFSPHSVPGLYDAYFEDQDKFERLYTQAEANPSIEKDTISAKEAFSLLMQERASTGRIYIQHVDHCNINGPFDERVAPVRQSNLCMEIALPTKPLDNVDDPDGEVALCTLSAFNLGKIESVGDFERLSRIVVRALDNLLDYQNYPLPAAERSTMRRRSLGVGIINYAHWVAKNGLKYSDGSANNKTHELIEAMQFYLLKASMELAKEKGMCSGFEDTKYAKGVMPVDRYKSDVDNTHTAELQMDWNWLRNEIVHNGLRNSTLSAFMPSETSSQVSNATNGIEPPRGYMSVKQSKDGILKQIVPGYDKYKDQYELLWNIKDNTGYLELVAIMQKFVDQAISANTNYDPENYPDGKVPIKKLLQDLVTCYRLGIKTLYYHNTRDGASDEQKEDDGGCDGGGCKI
ncbi:ribonucleotide reductase large subunit [Vibrio phage 3.058.O._10N.286.46.B8]|nr:coil containing protein [Vibrio phage 2.058.O._10N.286.46.B8]AUS03192.1 ribonucleotide reductase large subunit [Vibrio phage 3.058.O._10N.286.46.B8]